MKCSFNVVVDLFIKENKNIRFKFGDERDTSHGSFYDPWPRKFCQVWSKYFNITGSHGYFFDVSMDFMIDTLSIFYL